METLPFFFALVLYVACTEDDGSFSYQRFRGPVSGRVHEVAVPGHYRNQGYNVDYVAKPDYLYSYGVEDLLNGNQQIHKETRDGDKVLGSYKVLQPDGLLRVVEYTADATHGFKATVRYLKI